MRTEDESILLALRLEFKPGDYCLYSIEDFLKEIYINGASIHGLFSVPQKDCPTEPFAYIRPDGGWVEKKYLYGKEVTSDWTIMYLGPCIKDSLYSEAAMTLFPSLTGASKPFMYCLGTGTMDKCKTCKNEINWLNLNELPDSVRLKIQESIPKVNIDQCRLTKASFYIPVNN